MGKSPQWYEFLSRLLHWGKNNKNQVKAIVLSKSGKIVQFLKKFWTNACWTITSKAKNNSFFSPLYLRKKKKIYVDFFLTNCTIFRNLLEHFLSLAGLTLWWWCLPLWPGKKSSIPAAIASFCCFGPAKRIPSSVLRQVQVTLNF